MQEKTFTAAEKVCEFANGELMKHLFNIINKSLEQYIATIFLLGFVLNSFDCVSGQNSGHILEKLVVNFIFLAKKLKCRVRRLLTYLIFTFLVKKEHEFC